MAITYNTSIVRDGLVLYLDAANRKSKKPDTSLINCSSWTVGSTVPTGYNFSGDGNSILVDTNPFGDQDIVWQTLNNDVTGDADGGWNTGTVAIDPTKMYRFSVWFRRKVTGNGRFYLGTYGYTSAGVNIGVINRTDGVTVNTNPYFYISPEPFNLTQGEWYLVVGHVWPEGSGSGAVHVDTGVYNTAGAKVVTSLSNFIWNTGTGKTIHRSYLFYSTISTTNQQWYQPRIDVCDGSELSVQDLLNNVPNQWNDLTKNTNCTLVNSPVHDTSSGSVTFDGVDHYATVAQPTIQTAPNLFTICGWIYPNSATATAFFITPQSNGMDNYVSHYGASNNMAVTICEAADLNGRGISTAANTVPINKWSFFSVSINNLNVKIHVNGVLLVNQTETIPIAGWTGNWVIGSRGPGWPSSWMYSGKISNVSVYNRELSTTEIQKNFEALRGRYGV